MHIKKIAFILLLITFSIQAYPQKAIKDTPKTGEGINNFLLRNKRSVSEYKDTFLEINKGKFGKDGSLLMGVKYTIPPLNNKRKDKNNQNATTENNKTDKEPLFGKRYENYTIKSNIQKGACFFLSSGHGGPDSGAIGKANGKVLHEDEYAYDIMLRLARNLMENGAKIGRAHV